MLLLQKPFSSFPASLYANSASELFTSHLLEKREVFINCFFSNVILGVTALVLRSRNHWEFLSCLGDLNEDLGALFLILGFKKNELNMGISDVHSFTISIKSFVESKGCNVLHHGAVIELFSHFILGK